MAGKGSIEQRYQKVSQREHVLLRPEMYIGSIQATETPMWVVRGATNLHMEYRNVKLNQGLLKIFDEILVNASDNFHRATKAKPMTYIEIEVRDKHMLIRNDGPGIPVVKHAEHKLYVPDMIFGHLLTSSNYSNDPDSMTAGRHGYGAKLTNIFSHKFKLTTSCDGTSFTRSWTNNMADASEIDVKSTKNDDLTEIRFEPDFARFGCKEMDGDMLKIITRRCLDLAVAFPELTIKFNDRVMPSSFSKYVALFPQSDLRGFVFTSEKAGRGSSYKLGVFLAPEYSFRRDISAVNGVVTHNGGTHVAYFVEQLTAAAEKAAKLYQQEKSATVNLSVRKLVNALCLVAFCNVGQPKFDSQSKVRLVSDHSFGKVDTDELAKWILELPMLESFVQNELASVDRAIAKLQGRSTGHVRLPKLVDAALAGKGKEPCTLIVTEGDSAKALAVSSLTADMKQTFGVYPVRGKILNVRNDVNKLKNNVELQHLFLALGLRTADKDVDRLALRYQRVLLMTDQDVDGTHIRGLLINTFEYFWPKLAAADGFLELFITPLVKVRCKDQVHAFYNRQEFEAWEAAHKAKPDAPPYTVKYYKGLGTSTTAEGREYMNNLAHNTLKLIEVDSAAKKQLNHVFGADFADWRKDWVSSVSLSNEPAFTRLKVGPQGIRLYPLSMFLNTEFIHFAIADNFRVLPNVVDGLKPVQRKVLWAMLKRKDSEIKVSQLSGYVAMVSSYHHGDVSLQQAIIRMAQEFPGSNNVPLLRPLGQFGTRLQGGNDHAAPRYIFSRLHPLARAVFPEDDDPVLEYTVDDGQDVEPSHYAPVIPLVLANGVLGIGVGYATEILAHNPLDLSRLVKEKLQLASKAAKGKAPGKVDANALCPWVVGFRGTTGLVPNTKRCWSRGTYSLHEMGKSKKLQVRVTELPIKRSTESYREFLDGLVENKEVLDIDDYSSGTTVDIDLTMNVETVTSWLEEGVFSQKLGLVDFHSQNLNTISAENKVQSHGHDKSELFEQYFQRRLEIYKKRLAHLRVQVDKDITRTAALIKFSVELKAGKFNLVKMSTADLVGYLRTNKYPVNPDTDDYDYLTNRMLPSIMKENLGSLEARLAGLEKRKKDLADATPFTLWEGDLEKFDKAFAQHSAKVANDIEKELASRKVAPPLLKLPKEDPNKPPDPSRSRTGGPSAGKPVSGGGGTPAPTNSAEAGSGRRPVATSSLAAIGNRAADSLKSFALTAAAAGVGQLRRRFLLL